MMPQTVLVNCIGLTDIHTPTPDTADDHYLLYCLRHPLDALGVDNQRQKKTLGSGRRISRFMTSDGFFSGGSFIWYEISA